MKLSKNQIRKLKKKKAIERNNLNTGEMIVGLKLDTMIETDSKRTYRSLMIGWVWSHQSRVIRLVKIAFLISIIYSSGWSALNWQMILDLFI